MKHNSMTKCDGDLIEETFSAKIGNDYPVTKSVEFSFDTKLSDHQVFYDITLFDELIQSKIQNGIFKFFINEQNASEFNVLGFTFQDLSNIFPEILRK